MAAPPVSTALHRALANFLAESEFLGGFNADCTQTAARIGAHTLDPLRFPLTAAAQAGDVNADKAAGIVPADSHGSLTAAGLALHLTHVLRLPFSQHVADWEAALLAWAGIKPIVVQVAAASPALPVEPGVQGHAFAVGGITAPDGSGFAAASTFLLVGDGDNAADYNGVPVHYSLAQIRAARPFCVTLIEQEPPAAMPPPLAAPPPSSGADYFPAVWLPSPHFDAGPTTKRFVIIHGTGYSLTQRASDVAHDFQSSNPNSTHYAIGRAGDVAQMVHERDVAWGNGIVQAGPGHGAWWDAGPNPNQITISIEHVNDAQNATALTPAQQAASFALVRDICVRHGIPLRPADASGGITGHSSIESIDRAHCPGNYPWPALWAYLAAHGGAPVSPSPSAPLYTINPDGGVTFPPAGGRPAITFHFMSAATVKAQHTAVFPLTAETYWCGTDAYIRWANSCWWLYHTGAAALTQIAPDAGGRLLDMLVDAKTTLSAALSAAQDATVHQTAALNAAQARIAALTVEVADLTAQVAANAARPPSVPVLAPPLTPTPPPVLAPPPLAPMPAVDPVAVEAVSGGGGSDAGAPPIDPALLHAAFEDTH